jgi:hypothetical protein
MLRTIGVLSTICLLCVLPLQAQGLRAAPRPPAQAAGIPAGESAAPDGYAPIPAWLGQTRAPHPAKTASTPLKLWRKDSAAVSRSTFFLMAACLSLNAQAG